MYEIFVQVLTEMGGKATNKAMLTALGWDKDEYKLARYGLITAGKIKQYRCRGGGVELIKG